MIDEVSKLSEEERRELEFQLKCICPDDGKYAQKALVPYLSTEAEWKTCALVQKALLETRVEFGKAHKRNVMEIIVAMDKINPINMTLIEKNITKHDQLAVIQEIGNHVSAETKALLHPGTTSYDILDTARSYLFKECWNKEIKPKAGEVIGKLCDLAEQYVHILQVGRTHLQRTTPVPFCTTLALYAARLTERIEKCDNKFNDLRGKISGMVGTGASIEMVVGEGKSREFERKVLSKFNLDPDLTATQVVQKERLCDAGHSLVTMMYVLGDFADNMRILYSSEINEITSRAGEKRLGGSSADASKNNPINWENIAGKGAQVESGMRVLYEMMKTDLQRDLRSSVQARYQPHHMMTEVYESLCRASRCLNQLSVNEDKMAEHLQHVRDFPSEAMVAITRAQGWIHPEYGVGHDAVKEFSKQAKAAKLHLFDTAHSDSHFKEFYNGLKENEQKILNGQLELYVGSSKEDAEKNIVYSRSVISKKTA